MKKFIIILISIISLSNMVMSEDNVQVSISVINESNANYDSSLITNQDDIQIILFILSKNMKNKIFPEQYGSIMSPVILTIKRGNEKNQFYFSRVVDSKGSESGIAKDDVDKFKEIFKNNQEKTAKPTPPSDNNPLEVEGE